MFSKLTIKLLMCIDYGQVMVSVNVDRSSEKKESSWSFLKLFPLYLRYITQSKIYQLRIAFINPVSHHRDQFDIILKFLIIICSNFDNQIKFNFNYWPKCQFLLWSNKQPLMACWDITGITAFKNIKRRKRK